MASAPAITLPAQQFLQVYGIASVACCLSLMGCDQFARVGVASAAGTTGGATAVPHDGSAGSMVDVARTTDDAMSSDAMQSDAASVADDAGAACPSPEIALCNPVTNEGCSDLIRMQCAVDLAAQALAGYCIFRGPEPPPDLTMCLNTLVTESCPPKSTCVLGRCRTLCFCDAQCTGEDCCVEPIGNFGFKVCGSC